MIINKAKSSTLILESGMMFTAEGIGLMFAMFITIFRGRYLSVDDIGLIGYITTVIAFFSAFFNLGLDNTGARLVLNQKDKAEKKEITGMVLLLTIVLCAVFSVFMIIVNIFLPVFGYGQAVRYIYMILPFAGYNILLITFKQLCFGLGEIKRASFQLFISYVVYFAILFILQLTGNMNLATANFFSFAVNMLTVLLPVFYIYRKNLRWNQGAWDKIKVEQKERGWKIFFSRVIYISSNNLDVLILGFYHPLSSVAYYTLSKYFSMPILIAGNSISQSLYRKYGVTNHIDKRMLRTIVILVFAAAMGIYLISVGAVYVMGNEYRPVLNILPLSLLSYCFSGINAIYVSFMNAKGMANELRNLSIVGMLVHLVSGFALIIPFGAIGGIWSYLITIIVVLSMRIYYCNRYKKSE
jgi:O-antigen/teichoic acid export membrane protein